MKSIIALFGIIGFLGFQAFAETKEISNNNSFEEGKSSVPSGWIVNDFYKRSNKSGTMQILSESAQDGGKCILIKNGSAQVFELYGNPIAAVPGDVIRMSVYVKGKGSFKLSVYLYNGKNLWLDTVYPKSVKIEGTDWEKKDFEITLSNKEYKDKGTVAMIRPAIVVDADSEVCFDNFKGQIEKVTVAGTDKK